MTYSVSRSLQGIAMAAGAPLGWLLIERLRGVSPADAFAAQPDLYLYMLLGTIIAFGAFGAALGEREDWLERTNMELEELSVTDALTGLRNARYFHARLEEEQAERVRTGAPLSLVIIDLDHFKRVNDEHGHPIGDDVLANTARAISSVTRQGETEARVGGEEFGLLLPGSDVAAARDAAERVRRAIEAAVTPLPGGGTLRVTASAGVASTSVMPDATPAQLYRAADDALYAAKAAGRNCTMSAAAVSSPPE